MLNIVGYGVRAFVVEFASLDQMPITVNWFLQQIKRGLWDDSSFMVKASHVLLARPISYDQLVDKSNHFGDLRKLPVPEYSEEYPHRQYTLGLNHLSSLPSFYVNSIDNTILHGPKGESLDGKTEPCFGTVVRGSETIDLLDKLPTQLGDPYLFEHPVQVMDVRIVSSSEVYPDVH
jgi:Cyclophilin type peptidyl-prolyl cis-trans isomerase/CLD